MSELDSLNQWLLQRKWYTLEFVDEKEYRFTYHLLPNGEIRKITIDLKGQKVLSISPLNSWLIHS